MTREKSMREKTKLAGNEREVRAWVERGAAEVIVMNHAAAKNDTLKALDTTFTPVIARIAAKKGVALGIDLAMLRALDAYTQARELARIQRAIEVCRKAGAGIAVLHARDKRSAHAFLLALGASTQQAADSISDEI